MVVDAEALGDAAKLSFVVAAAQVRGADIRCGRRDIPLEIWRDCREVLSNIGRSSIPASVMASGQRRAAPERQAKECGRKRGRASKNTWR